jgi:Flp pilus assembly protein TadG
VTQRFGQARSLATGPVAPPRRTRAGRGDDGMVTAEFAVALPAFVLVVLAALSGVAVMTAQLRCADAADIAARMAARGDTTGVVQAAALTGAPGSAHLELSTTATLVTATVRARLSLPGLSRFLPGVVVQAHVTEQIEPSGSHDVGGDAG